MKKQLVVFAFAIVLCCSTFLQNSDAADTKIIKLSTVFVSGDPFVQTLEEIAKNVNERTNGSIRIDVYPNGQIASYKDGVELVARGANFISTDDPSYLGDYVPDYKALVGPMLYQSIDEYSAMCQTDFANELNKKAEAKGIKVLALDFTFGFRNVVANKAVRTPADLKGLKIRVPKSQLWIDTLTAMGASPTPLPWSETYSAVQQKVVDGVETSIVSFETNNLIEVTKDISKTQHFLGTGTAMISMRAWNSFTDKERAIMQDEFTRGAKRNNEIVKASVAKLFEKAKKDGATITEIDRASFADVTKTVFEKTPGLSEGIYERIQKELTAIRNK